MSKEVMEFDNSDVLYEEDHTLVTFIVTDADQNIRIDKYLTNVCQNLEDFNLSRSYIQSLLKDEAILVNGKIVKANYKVVKNDEVTIAIPQPKTLDIEPEDIPLDIIYEDDDIIVINKGKGMVVHPAAG
ncbi:S4 domain-containing protein, partial [Anaerosporobacter sp.]